MIELRAQQIIIDQPRLDSVPFVAIVVQRIVYDTDGNVTQIINREKVINRALPKVYTEQHHYHEPFAVEPEHISCAGLASALLHTARAWIMEEYPSSSMVDHRVVMDGNN